MDAAFDYLTKPIVETWAGLIRRAKDAKREFEDRGAQIEQFYSGKPGFMSSGDYQNKFMGGSNKTSKLKFQLEFNKAFEYVAVMGPLLFWRMADRKVRPFQALSFDQSALSSGDPLKDQFLTSLVDQQMSTDARNRLRSQVQERVLNHLPKIQPPAGLIAEAGRGVFDALLKGAGFLVSEKYQFPGSEKTLVGSFNVPCDDVLVDADCRSPLWSDAGWIGIRHRQRVDVVERMFRLRPGSLRKYAGLTSSNGQSGRDPRTSTRTERKQDSTKNVIEWYEIFSKGGLGNQFAGKQAIEPELEELAGDYAYLCICPKCPWPLNINSTDLESNEADDQWLSEKTQWPTEYWRDNRWPVSKLSFYEMTNTSAWPLPPLSAAVGEMTVANILIATYVQGAYENSQQLIGVFEGACKELQSVLNASNSPQVIELNAGVHKSIADVMQFINRPEINGDVPRTIEFLFGLIEQRTGMSQMLYGEGGSTNSRSAAEYQGRQQTVNIRPEYMRKCVGEWMSEVASKELFGVYSHMDTSDVADMLGPFGALAWQELVVNEDPETVLRSSECYVEASDIGRPNHERDASMLATMQQYLLPILSGHMAQSGDPTPLNGFLTATGHATNMDVTPFLIPPPETGDPEAAAQQQQLQQMTQQLEMQRQQAEIAKLSADARRADADGQASLMQAQTMKSDAQAKMMSDAQENQAKLELASIKLESARQDIGLRTTLAAHQQQLAQQGAEHAAMLRSQASQTQAGMAEHAAGLRQQDATFKSMATQAQAESKLGALDAASRIKQEAAASGLMAKSAAAQQALIAKSNTSQQDLEAKYAAAQVKQGTEASSMMSKSSIAQQSLQAKETAAQQKLVMSLIEGQQRLKQASESHQQSAWILDEKAVADAKRANEMQASKLLMQAVAADQQRNMSRE